MSRLQVDRPVDRPDAEVDETIETLRSIRALPLAPWRRELALLALVLTVLGAVLLDISADSDTNSAHLYAEVRAQVKAEHQWLRTALAGGLNGYLQETPAITLVAATGGDQDGLLVTPGDNRAVSQLNANWRLTATVRSHVKVVDQLEVVLVIESLQNDKQQFEDRLAGSVHNVHDLLANILAIVHVRLGLDARAAHDFQVNGALMPQDSLALKHYAQGLDALAVGRAQQAIESLQVAAANEAMHPAIEETLSRAFALAGYKQQAKKHVAIAYGQRQRLAKEQQLLVAGRYHMLYNQWQRAEELFRALHEFYPNHLRYGLQLAEAQSRGSRYQSALETLSNLESNPVFSQDARVPLYQAMVRQRQGSWPQGLSAVQKSYALAEKNGQQTVAADALFWQLQLGSPFDFKKFEKAQQLYEKLGNPEGQSRTLRAFGKAAYRAGELTRSRSFYRRAASLAELHGLEGELATAQTNLAIIEDLKGDLVAGLSLKQAVLANYQRRDVQGGIGITQENIGISLRKLGQLARANQLFEQAAVNFEQVGDKIGQAWVPLHSALIHLDLGAIEKAKQLLGNALTLAQQHPEGGLLGMVLLAQGNALHASGEFDAAEVAARAAHEHLQAQDQKLHRGEAALLLSRIALAQGDSTQARVWLLQAELQFETSGALANRALALQQHLRLGDDACSALAKLEAKLQELRPKLLSKLWLASCPTGSTDLEKLQIEVATSELFEPKLKLAYLFQPTAAKAFAQKQGWSLLAL